MSGEERGMSLREVYSASVCCYRSQQTDPRHFTDSKTDPELDLAKAIHPNSKSQDSTLVSA